MNILENRPNKKKQVPELCLDFQVFLCTLAYLLQPLMPAFRIWELIFEKRYK